MTLGSGSIDFLQTVYDFELQVAGVLGDWGIPFAPVVVAGSVADPGIYDLPALTPTSDVSVTYRAAGAPVSDSYTGIKLYDLLNDAGGVSVSATKNDVLSKYVIATGSDGYKAAFSLGEISPKFGNQPVLVAYADGDGQLGPDGSEGLARMVVPGDAAGGRYVSDLVSLQVGGLPEPPAAGPGGASDAFTLSGQVAGPGTFTPITLADVAPPVTETATYLSGAGSVSDTYTGVSLWSLVQNEGLLTDPSIKNDILRFGVVATGSDGYRALISMGEIDPAFGNQPDIVAYADTLGQLGPGGADGAMRLVVPGDAAGGRYISNLVDLQVVDLTATTHA